MNFIIGTSSSQPLLLLAVTQPLWEVFSYAIITSHKYQLRPREAGTRTLLPSHCTHFAVNALYSVVSD